MSDRRAADCETCRAFSGFEEQGEFCTCTQAEPSRTGSNPSTLPEPEPGPQHITVCTDLCHPRYYRQSECAWFCRKCRVTWEPPTTQSRTGTHQADPPGPQHLERSATPVSASEQPAPASSQAGAGAAPPCSSYVRDKAQRLVDESRVHVVSGGWVVRGDHGTYSVACVAGHWMCDCRASGRCSHSLAAEIRQKQRAVRIGPATTPITR